MCTMLAIVMEFQLSSCKSSRSCSSQYKKKKKKKEALRRKGGMDFIWWAPVYYFWLQRLVKVVKSVKKDVESRVESKGLYRGIKVVFFFNF